MGDVMRIVTLTSIGYLKLIDSTDHDALFVAAPLTSLTASGGVSDVFANLQSFCIATRMAILDALA